MNEMTSDTDSLASPSAVEMLRAWERWWNETGFRWYKDGEFPSHEKPPFLRQDSPLYQAWMTNDVE